MFYVFSLFTSHETAPDTRVALGVVLKTPKKEKVAMYTRVERGKCRLNAISTSHWYIEAVVIIEIITDAILHCAFLLPWHPLYVIHITCCVNRPSQRCNQNLTPVGTWLQITGLRDNQGSSSITTDLNESYFQKWSFHFSSSNPPFTVVCIRLPKFPVFYGKDSERRLNSIGKTK